MKNKLKHKPILYTAVILAILFVILIVSAIGMFYYAFSIPEPEGLSLASWPHTFTDNFSTWIEEKDGNIGVEQIGAERLDEYGLWVQILDEKGQEIYAHNKPENYPDGYSMTELVELTESGYENGNTVFISNVTISDRTLNYIVGFPYAIGKTMLYYNGENVARLSPFTKSVVFFSACVVVLVAFVYAFWLSRKLATIINGIKSIAANQYTPLKERGLFSEIYGSLNEMNMKIRHSEKVQQETDHARKEWIANITHDLKTPLSPVKGYAELLAEGRSLDLPTVQEYGKIVLKNVNHMEKLINDLKLTYQLEAGAFPFAPQEIRIVRFLKELVIDIANDPAFSKRTIAFESSMQEMTLAVDPDLLRRAVGNIVINALVHNPVDTKVKVTVNLIPGNKIDEPFQYGYYEGWEIIISSFELLMFALLAVCIVIAPVFSGEYEAGTDAVILSAKYGKTKLTTAKIVASYLFGALAFTLHVIVAFCLPLAAFGFDGWDLSLQIVNTTIPYPWTFLQAVLVNLGVVYLVLFAMLGLTLLLSAKMKSSYLVLIVLVPILFIPLFLSPNGTTGAYNLTLFLLPYRSTVPEIGKYISYQLGGLVLDAFTMRAILYAILTAVMLPLARLGFKKHQVG